MYFARALNKSETDLDMGRFGRMGVFRRTNGEDELIGSYIRNYATAFDTFFPFQANGKDLALYSPDYTATRIMELPSCRDLGGEEPDEMGFCPVDYFVPSYIVRESISNAGGPFEERYINRLNNPDEKDFGERTEVRSWVDSTTNVEITSETTCRQTAPLVYYDFGFVAGCIWGDDSSWKVQYLDLSEAHKGILKREERFGYVELIEDMRLREAIDVYCFRHEGTDQDTYRIYIKCRQTFDLESGKVVDPFE